MQSRARARIKDSKSSASGEVDEKALRQSRRAFEQALRDHVQALLSPDADPVPSCPRCKGTAIDKKGYTHRYTGRLPTYICRGCGQYFNRLSFTPLAQRCRSDAVRPSLTGEASLDGMPMSSDSTGPCDTHDRRGNTAKICPVCSVSWPTGCGLAITPARTTSPAGPSLHRGDRPRSRPARELLRRAVERKAAQMQAARCRSAWAGEVEQDADSTQPHHDSTYPD